MVCLRGRIVQIVSPSDMKKEGYLQAHFMSGLERHGLCYVVLRREDCPASLFKRIIWIVRHRKEGIDSWGKGWSWPVIMKNPTGSLGDIVEVEVEPVFEQTEMWYSPTRTEASVTTRKRLVSDGYISVTE